MAEEPTEFEQEQYQDLVQRKTQAVVAAVVVTDIQAVQVVKVAQASLLFDGMKIKLNSV